MQVRGHPGRLPQQLRLSVVHDLGQEHAFHPREHERALMRYVADGQTQCAVVGLTALRDRLGVRPYLAAEIVRVHLQRIGSLFPGMRSNSRQHDETVRVHALQDTGDTGRLEAARQAGVQALQHGRGLLQPRQLRPQAVALLGSGVRSEAHSIRPEPARQIGGEPGRSVEGRDDLVHPPRVGLRSVRSSWIDWR